MKRTDYINIINQKLNEIEGDKEYRFHIMSREDISHKMEMVLFSGCFDLFNTTGLQFAKDEFSKLAAMCMIAMEAVDLKLNINKKGKKK